MTGVPHSQGEKKKLRLFNGRAHGKYMRGYHASIAAYSKADAARVLAEAFGQGRGYMTEINTYYAECWGTDMDGITPERGCWVIKEFPRGKPERIA